MWLIIAVILVAVFVARLSVDKFTTNVAIARIEAQREKIDEWEEKYVDRVLERKIEKFMDEPSNQKAIWKEVSAALEQMTSWPVDHEWIFSYQEAPKSQEDLIYKNRGVAHDILLANRGKVYSTDASYGRDTHFYSYSEAIKYYELARWIQKTLKKQNIDLELYYKVRNTRGHIYVWEGSGEFHCYLNRETMKILERSDLNFLAPVKSIPKAYCEK